MDTKRAVVLAGLLGCMAFGLSFPQSCFAQDSALTPRTTVDPHLQEASVFFNRLAQTSDNPVIAAMAKDSFNKLSHQEAEASNQPPKQVVEVPMMVQQNQTMAVPVVLNQKTMATFVVDTGASYTVVTPRVAEKMGLIVTPDTPRVTILTANGLIKVPMVTLDTLAIGGLKVHNVQAVIQDLGSDIMLSGLLGMNVFQQVDLTVKADRLVLSMR